jgi:methylthioribose-1-phosphate isomerase
VTAAYGMYAAVCEAKESGVNNIDEYIREQAASLKAARPTAVNLAWAVNRQLEIISAADGIDNKIRAALEEARTICEDDVEQCRAIGRFGAEIIKEISEKKSGEPVNILTHCNAGWLATVDFGTATAPIYQAVQDGIDVHVWVDETRPRNQGAKLTAFELTQEGVPNTLIVDNVGGHLMQQGMVDIVIVGSDRTTYTGDVANKIGTYLKALAAADNNIPFYVALPSSTIDWQIEDGVKNIPIEQRDPAEVLLVDAVVGNKVVEVNIAGKGTKAANYAFDVTPSRLVTGLITERGVCAASAEGTLGLFPEKQDELS